MVTINLYLYVNVYISNCNDNIVFITDERKKKKQKVL